MKAFCSLICVGLLAASPLLAEEPQSQPAPDKAPKVRLRLDQVLPKDWKAAEIETGAVPYGMGSAAGGTGLAITLQGPMMVQGPKGEPRLECLTIWIMPEEFQPPKGPFPGALTPPVLFGPIGKRYFGPPDKWLTAPIEKGKRYLIYVKAWTELKSWPTWETDIRDYFGIREASKPGPPDALPR